METKTVVLLVQVVLVLGHKVEQAEDGSSGTISFSTPDLSDEDSHSPFMPDALRCDACRAIAYQVLVLQTMHSAFFVNPLSRSPIFNA